jgi:hypothetical protein
MPYGKVDTVLGRICITKDTKVIIIRDVSKVPRKNTYVKFDTDYLNRAINLEMIAYRKEFSYET